MTTSGSLVVGLREESGLSQRALAARAGCTRSTISRIESGEMDPTVTMLARIAAAAGRRLTVRADETAPSHSLAAVTSNLYDNVDHSIPWTKLRALVDWMHWNRERALAAICDPPARTSNEQLDNLLAAIAEKTADDEGALRPSWAHDVPALGEAWRAPGTPRMQAKEANEAPTQFVNRNILLAETNLWRRRD